MERGPQHIEIAQALEIDVKRWRQRAEAAESKVEAERTMRVAAEARVQTLREALELLLRLPLPQEARSEALTALSAFSPVAPWDQGPRAPDPK